VAAILDFSNGDSAAQGQERPKERLSLTGMLTGHVHTIRKFTGFYIYIYIYISPKVATYLLTPATLAVTP